jgi:rare lipoprotein A
MKYILILTSFLLASCQTPQQKTRMHHESVKQHVTPTSSTYNRYTYINNRYTQKQDSAPLKQKKLYLKEPTPAKEPLSRYGNPADYHVDGRHYEIMKNPAGYKSRGIASWYGTKFHKQRTSSGEPYDMYVMTAAHKTLPLPTYIRVKNLSNGREAVVKVNDRGPFHSNRIIDLSYAAAVKLGIYPAGTAPVEIETLVGPDTQGRYFLQAGAFSTEHSANHLKEQLRKMTTSPILVEHFRQHYIVRVGPFGNKSMAERLKSKLALNGVRGAFSVLI